LRGGGRGDLLVHVQVNTPKKLSTQQKDLLRKLAETLDGSAPNEPKGILSKVKDALGQ
jgi:molecular chaperone DnaJ